MKLKYLHLYFLCSVLSMPVIVPGMFAQQIQINRIESLPNIPSPYEMRPWKEVARGYDDFVFDFSKTGDYLPLISTGNMGVNYPDEQTVRLNTVVGTTAPGSSEAINMLPAIVGATLVGIDKRNQNGLDYVRKSREFFNRRPEENVYLNHPSATSGSDWWYDTMPNVFFYQVYDLYEGVEEHENQFRTVADQWLTAVRRMGGSAVPWTRPNMNYRGWYLASMTPNATGVREPEAAGAIGWLLYNAYLETGDPKYRIGAEWAMEFLNSRTSNPSYELQLSYGAYAAARMNAELGTGYDIQKIVNWCFDVGPLRNWGMIRGTWGGYSVGGLIGEVNGFNDYAFLMNTFQQIGALVPMVRYDDRFARAIGKWVLNTANAVRLFYPASLPAGNQDNFTWAETYDTASVIGYEALRQSHLGQSPYATGDAMAGGWGLTNLALYGSSHVGYMAGIVDTTDVGMILKLDLLKTDFFSTEAYPTYLLYNPFDEEKTVTVTTGPESYDLYDAVNNEFIAFGVTGDADVTIPPDAAVMLVIVPTGGSVTYENHKMLVNDIVVDYRSGADPGNYAPRIKALKADMEIVAINGSANVYCTVTDRDGDELTYMWSTDAGSVTGTRGTVLYTAPDQPGEYTVVCAVHDGKGGSAVDSTRITVVSVIPVMPEIKSIDVSPRKLDVGAAAQIVCIAEDPGGHDLLFSWNADDGEIEGTGPAIQWNAPAMPGNYTIRCAVENETGGRAVDSVMVPVRDFSVYQSGELVAYYTFAGDALDRSGFEHHGTVYGAVPAADRTGAPQQAYFFDGVNDAVRVGNTPALNFRDGITVGMWISINAFYTREAYPISHGNWENRWKISVGDRRFRWTVKTSEGIKDLDSETMLEVDTYYHVAVVYDGADIEIYIDGELDAFGTFSGQLLETSIDLMIGQVLPEVTDYNFRGTIDEVRIYNYALPMDEIRELYTSGTSVAEPGSYAAGSGFYLYQNYPNPFNPSTVIRFRIPTAQRTTITVYDILGRSVAVLLDREMDAGEHHVEWHAERITSGVYFYTIESGEFTETRRLIVIK
jgi:hypothetical protein